MDPGYRVTRVDKPLSAQDLATLQARVNYDLGNVRRAVQLEAVGQHAAAIEVWKHIFVHGFPS